jgi:hypothetical protein
MQHPTTTLKTHAQPSHDTTYQCNEVVCMSTPMNLFGNVSDMLANMSSHHSLSFGF